MNQKVIIDKDICIGCGHCQIACVAHNIHIVHGKAETIIEDCIKCGHCGAICPKKAITIEGFEKDMISQKENIRLNPNEVLHTIRFRRSIRHFKEEKISNEIIQQILEAGRLTHTAKNMQDVSFIVLDKEKAHMEKLAVAMFKKIKPIANMIHPIAKNNVIDDHFFFFHAPIVIVILAKDKTNGLLAAQNMEFVAEANGLGVLYSGYFTMAANTSFKIKKAMHVPKGKKVAMTFVIGYPDIKYLRSTQHKALDVQYR